MTQPTLPERYTHPRRSIYPKLSGVALPEELCQVTLIPTHKKLTVSLDHSVHSTSEPPRTHEVRDTHLAHPTQVSLASDVTPPRCAYPSGICTGPWKGNFSLMSSSPATPGAPSIATHLGRLSCVLPAPPIAKRKGSTSFNLVFHTVETYAFGHTRLCFQPTH